MCDEGVKLADSWKEWFYQSLNQDDTPVSLHSK